MSWSRGWLPRFASPFTSRPSSATNASPISPSDYNYIDPDELEPEEHSTTKPRQHSDAHMHMHRPHKDSDAVLLRHKRVTYPVHFPPHSIDDGVLTVGEIRREAARVVDRDPRRVKLLYKGKSLDDNARRCADVGLSSYGQPEIMVVASEAADDDEASGDDDDDGEDPDAPAGTEKRKRKNRSRKGRRRKGAADDTPASPSPSRGHSGIPRAGAVEHLPIPSGTHPTHRAQTTRSPSPAAPAPAPTSMEGKLAAIHARLAELTPLASAYIDAPPADKERRITEHTRITETIMSQVLLKTDDIQTDDVAVRAKRKELVNEIQSWLTRMDAAKDGK